MTYSPATIDAVPLARRRFTAEFGMGSGVDTSQLSPGQQRSETFEACEPAATEVTAILKQMVLTLSCAQFLQHILCCFTGMTNESNQADRAISIG